MPTGPYHASKAAATMAALGLCIEKNLELAVLRPFHVYGEGEAPYRFWPQLKKAARNGDDFPMTEGLQIRDFVSVEQVARSFLKAIERTDLHPGEPVIENLGSGIPRTLLEFASSEWERLKAAGRLVPNAIPLRENEVMRYVPEI
jgi:nucleoside-diphosphate-sugar epimerase